MEPVDQYELVVRSIRIDGVECKRGLYKFCIGSHILEFEVETKIAENVGSTKEEGK